MKLPRLFRPTIVLVTEKPSHVPGETLTGYTFPGDIVARPIPRLTDDVSPEQDEMIYGAQLKGLGSSDRLAEISKLSEVLSKTAFSALYRVRGGGILSPAVNSLVLYGNQLDLYHNGSPEAKYACTGVAEALARNIGSSVADVVFER